MNSSGIKRGLATTAVSALAVAGIPFIATSANAAAGDEIQSIAYKGPVRDGGSLGGLVVLKTKNLTAAEITLVASDLNVATPVNNPNQTVSIVSKTLIADGATNEFGGADGFDEIHVMVAVDTPQPGQTASFALYGEDGGTAGVQANEARIPVELTTAGAPASVTISPATQTTGESVPSGNYTLTIRDAGGNTTQLTGAAPGGEDLDIASAPAGVVISNPQIDADEAPRGTATFTATSATKGLFTINVTGDAVDGPSGVSGSAQLDVIGAATGITAGEIDIVTGKDDWNGFGGKAFGSTTNVRADQRSITINVNSPANKNTVVRVTATGTGVTFDNGAGSKSYPVTLDGNGVGSITVTPDAASIAAGDSIAFTSPSFAGGGTITTAFVNRAFVLTESANNYISAFGGTVSPTVTVTDQFGDPYTGVFVTVQRTGGVNADAAESPRKAVDANGQVSFDLTDTKATAASKASDTLTFRVYPGELGAVLAENNNDAKPVITYTADGKGADFSITGDSVSPTGAAYDPNAVSALPLTDTNASVATEWIDLAIVGGNTGAPVTVSVDGDALVLTGSETRLAQGAASKTGKVGDNFDIIGTKAGLITVTVTTGGITKTGQFSVRTASQATPFVAAAAVATARNVDVSGPTAAAGGSVVEFVATFTDAFGNPVRGIDPNAAPAQFSTLLLGPATLKGNSGASNADGQITFTVELDQDAANDVTFQVTGATTTGQFGAAADRLDDQDTSNTGPGLTASKNVDSAVITDVVDIAELEQAVADAEEALEDAEQALAAAQGNLDVAATELAVAQANVDTLQAKKVELRKKLNKAKANDNKQKAKTTRKKLRNVKLNLRAAQDQVTIATAKVTAAQGIVDDRTQDVADAQADLDEAEQNLEDAQN